MILFKSKLSKSDEDIVRFLQYCPWCEDLLLDAIGGSKIPLSIKIRHSWINDNIQNYSTGRMRCLISTRTNDMIRRHGLKKGSPTHRAVPEGLCVHRGR